MSVALVSSTASSGQLGSRIPLSDFNPLRKPEVRLKGVEPTANRTRITKPTQSASRTHVGTVPAMRTPRRPTFEELPLRSPDDPKASAWGLYGAEDELGTLNLLTPEVRQRAWEENKLGIVVPLSLPMNVPRLPMNPRRKPMAHNILGKGYANDDELHINTQGSSHWDGLRHYPYQDKDKPRFYNGASQADITGPDASNRIGVQNLAQQGIAGRAVLLDWRSYALRNKINYSPFDTHGIPLSQLLEVAEEQEVTFKQGDILLIRTGWTEEYHKLTPEEQIELAQRDVRSSVGVEASRDMIKWHWDQAFAAVASDTNAYEAWPSPRPWGVSCHEVFLSGWGMPIGEVWDLEALAAQCAEIGRWEFYLTSVPLNVPGGVASPSNAMAML